MIFGLYPEESVNKLPRSIIQSHDSKFYLAIKLINVFITFQIRILDVDLYRPSIPSIMNMDGKTCTSVLLGESSTKRIDLF